MADFYRVNGSVGAVGDGKGFISTAAGASFIGKFPIALAIVIQDGSLNKANLQAELGVNYAVEGILKAISANTTILAYQIEANTNGNLSLLLEGAEGLSSTDAGIASIVQSMIRNGGNGAGYYGNNNVNASGSVVVNNGFRITYAGS